MNVEIQQELKRLEQLSEMQLFEMLGVIDQDPAPEWVKILVTRKINSILNQRIGLEA